MNNGLRHLLGQDFQFLLAPYILSLPETNYSTHTILYLPLCATVAISVVQFDCRLLHQAARAKVWFEAFS